MEGAKVAFITAEELNKKDPIAVVGKLSGGFLVVENAGELNEEIVEDMSKAMEFKTNRLTVILEDLKPGIRSLEEKYPEFIKKFDSRIVIPVFTNDELVSFAKTYAKELGYKIDDMAVLALYTLIGDNQNEENPVTIGTVRGMMDEAIKKASKKGRRLGKKVAKRHLEFCPFGLKCAKRCNCRKRSSFRKPDAFILQFDCCGAERRKIRGKAVVKEILQQLFSVIVRRMTWREL